MTTDFAPLEITPGCITIESVSGRYTDSACHLYINTLEKRVAAMAAENNVVLLYADERTRRGGELCGEDNNFTQVRLPEGWLLSVERGRYCARIIGVKISGPLDHDIPVFVKVS